MTKIVRKKLPASPIRDPAGIKAQSEFVSRTTSFLLILGVLVVGLVWFSEDTGKATTTAQANISNSSLVNCYMSLTSGTNMVSFNCISNSADRSLVFQNTDTAVINGVYEYRNKASDQWRVYAPNLPSYVVHDLTQLSRLKGYIITVQSGQNTLVNYTGPLAATSSIPLLLDNNLVGYPSIVNGSLPEVLSSINATYLRVRHYNGSDWLEFNRTDGALGLENVTPLEGYWITMSATDTWEVSAN